MGHEPLADRFAAFGWNVIEINGDSIPEVDGAFATAKEVKGKPTVILANTTKGYGSPLMENKAGWHHHLPTQAEYEQIKRDFAAGKERARHE